MALTFKINTYTAGSSFFDDNNTWTFTTSELDAWITTVNANPSNASRQVTKLRDYTNSTSANVKGFVIQFGHPSLSDLVMMFRSIASTSMHLRSSTLADYTDDTSNSGYGNLVNGYGNSNAASVMIGSSDSTNWVITNDVDGEEFFFAGWMTSSTTYQIFMYCFKDTHGEWVTNPTYDTYVLTNPYMAAFDNSGIFNPYYAVSAKNATNGYNGKIVPTLYYNSTQVGENRLVNKLACQAASALLGGCDSAIPFGPYYSTTSNKDWVSLSGYMAVDMTGVI